LEQCAAVGQGQRIGLIGAALVVAALAFLLFSGGDDDEDSTPAPSTTGQTLQGEPTATVPAPKPKPEVDVVRVVGGEPKGGVKEITVEKGDTVRFDVRSDTAAEVHVHGYELIKDAGPGEPVGFRFKANIEGVFEVELEGTHTQIVQLTVEP
jgi:heme/copper-type cytochrome/quinol oxidase subunit 2